MRVSRTKGSAAAGILILLASFVYGGEGILYEHRTTAEPWSIHIANVDPDDFCVELERALGKGIGRETVSSMAFRKGSVMAVNGGFFRIGGTYDGEPLGVLKIGEEWFSEPSIPRGALGWKAGAHGVIAGRFSMRWSVRIGDRSFEVNGINRERGAYQIVVFTGRFHETTLTHAGGTELIVGTDRRVIHIESGGNAPIPEGGLVVSFGSRIKDRVPSTAVGQEVSATYQIDSPELHSTDAVWSDLDFIVGGTPLLIREGIAVEDYEIERVRDDFVQGRHPRTAVGVRADGHWVFVVVDGRRPGVSVGMTIGELTKLMASLGCVQALNLDGGGSATFFLYGRVLSLPSDLTGERPVSDALLVRSCGAR